MVILGMLLYCSSWCHCLLDILFAQSSNPTENEGFCSTKTININTKLRYLLLLRESHQARSLWRKVGILDSGHSIVASVVDMDTAGPRLRCGSRPIDNVSCTPTFNLCLCCNAECHDACQSQSLAVPCAECRLPIAHATVWSNIQHLVGNRSKNIWKFICHIVLWSMLCDVHCAYCKWCIRAMWSGLK